MARTLRAVIHVHDGTGPRLATLRRANVVDRSFALSDAGSATITLSQRSSQSTERLIDYDRVYVIESPYGLGPWVGLLEEYREDGALLTLQLRELIYLFSQRYTGPNDTYSALLGNVAASMLNRARQAFVHPFAVAPVDDPGPMYAATLRDQRILDQLRAMVRDTVYGWWVDYDLSPSALGATFHWGRTRDASGAVATLEEGRNLERHPVHVNRGNRRVVRATVVGSAAPTSTYLQRPRATVNAEQQGPLDAEALVRAEELLNATAAREAALALLEASRLDQYELTVTDVALWPALVLGATVRVRLPSYGLGAGLDFTARVTELHPDETRRTLTLTVEVI